MKKFVIVLISFLVLFVFFMLNYLLWDKENLLKLRDNDKVQQDWLRGQNLTLQTTVEDLEQSVKTLDIENDAQKDKIVDLELQVRLALQGENDNLKVIQAQNNALSDYKSFMEDELKKVIVQWFSDVTNNNFEESIIYLDKNFKLWGKLYNTEQYIDFISDIQIISMQKEQKDGDKPFTILEDQGEAYEIITQIQVEVSIKEDQQESFQDLKSGSNTLEMIFRYDPGSNNWEIMSVFTLKVGSP